MAPPIKKRDARAADGFHRLAARLALAVSVCGSLFVTACSVGPKYARPSVQTPAAYKEQTSADSKDTTDWKTAQPNDAALRGKWWEIFGDPQLNALEEQVSVSNQNIAAAAANFLAARTLVRQARSQYFPTVSVAPSITNSLSSTAEFGGVQTSGSSSSSGFKLEPFTAYTLPFDASWEPDLWGRVGKTVTANAAAAQASAADLENVRLSAQAELAGDYYQIRAQDALKQLFDSTVVAYQEALELTQLRYKAGIDSDEDVAQAETQLEATQAQDTNLGILRAQFEHAIALLAGQSASTFSLPAQALKAAPPPIPLGVPAQLLERRPDIAAAERFMVQANAQIGIAETAFYPNITLSATGGFGSSSIVSWFTWPSRYWSVGPAVAETLFDAGLRRATVQQYQASYDQAVANYRQTVLTAFQQVEDNLAALRILLQEIQQQDTAVQSAERNLLDATNRYKAGIDPYLNVITAQATLLSNQQTAVDLRMQQMTAGVQLVKALGGGWDTSQIPSSKDLSAKTSANPPSTP